MNLSLATWAAQSAAADTSRQAAAGTISKQMQQLEPGIARWLYDPLVSKLVTAAVSLLVVVVLVRILQRTVSRYIADTDTRYRARKAVGLLGYGTAAVLLASIFSDRLRGLSVALGVAGAGIAFALQEVIASVAGWLAVSWGGFYRTGDRVQLGGIMGDVIDIGMLRTTVMECGGWVRGDQYNGRVVRIANSFVFKEPVFNYSGDFPFLWDEIQIPIKYGSDRKLARDILNRVAVEVIGDAPARAAESWSQMLRHYRLEDATLEPLVTLIANDNWLEYTLRYVVDYKRRRTTKDLLFSRILEEIDKTKDRVAMASATFHLVETPVFDVRLQPPSGPLGARPAE